MNALLSRFVGKAGRARSSAPRSNLGVVAFQAARSFDADGRHEDAVGELRKAVAAGFAPAATLLGARLLAGREEPHSPQEGVEMIHAAELAGDPDATAILATLTAAGGLVEQSWPMAFDLLQRAGERGSERARAQLLILAGDRELVAEVRNGEVGPQAWGRLRRSIDFAAWTTAPAKRAVCQSPRVRVAEGLAPPEVCDWLIERARDKLQVALMYDGAARKALWMASRTCSEYAFDIIESDLVLLLLRARAGVLLNMPTSAMEPPQVFHYAQGQEIKAHYDHVYGGTGHGRDGAFTSERIVSLLIYLNDGYEGGELEFPKVGFRHKGRKGDAVFFANVGLDGQRDPLSLHAGLPIVEGEKWLLSQWVHDQPFTSYV